MMNLLVLPTRAFVKASCKYVVEQMEPELCMEVFDLGNPCSQQLIDQVNCSQHCQKVKT
jgi:hypothetical protein